MRHITTLDANPMFLDTYGNYYSAEGATYLKTVIYVALSELWGFIRLIRPIGLLPNASIYRTFGAFA